MFIPKSETWSEIVSKLCIIPPPEYIFVLKFKGIDQRDLDKPCIWKTMHREIIPIRKDKLDFAIYVMHQDTS